MRRPAAVIGLLATAVLACAGCRGSATGAADTGFVQVDGSIVTVPVAERQAPVELTGQTLQGGRVDLAAYRGHPVVLNVWGSWCAPCRKEAPALQAASVRLAKQGVRTVGINTQDDDVSRARAFERRFGITYPSIVDDGALLLRLRGAVSPNAIPTTLVLDAEGRVAARATLPMTTVTLLDLVHDAAGA